MDPTTVSLCFAYRGPDVDAPDYEVMVVTSPLRTFERELEEAEEPFVLFSRILLSLIARVATEGVTLTREDFLCCHVAQGPLDNQYFSFGHRDAPHPQEMGQKLMDTADTARSYEMVSLTLGSDSLH